MTRIDWQAILGMGVLLMASGCVTNATTEAGSLLSDDKGSLPEASLYRTQS